MGDGGAFLLQGVGLASILLFIFSKACTCFISSISVPSISLHLLQHWLLNGAGPLAGIV